MSKSAKIRFEFETTTDRIREFEGIFYDLSRLERIHRMYLYEKYKLEEYHPKFSKEQEDSLKVYYISKKSPFDIGLFIKDHWAIFVAIGTFLATYPRLKKGTKEFFNDADNIINTIEEKLKELTEDFPGFEREVIKEFVEWFLEQSEEKKNYILDRYRFIGRALNKITKIFKDD